MDMLTPEQRSEHMSRIGPKDSKPEMTVRRMVYAMGYRYRLHRRDLPGKPDMVFLSRRKVIFIHGCFWHLHQCLVARPPRSNRRFWNAKLNGNQRRDAANLQKLTSLGWEVLVVWECELSDRVSVAGRIRSFLESDNTVSGNHE